MIAQKLLWYLLLLTLFNEGIYAMQFPLLKQEVDYAQNYSQQRLRKTRRRTAKKAAAQGSKQRGKIFGRRTVVKRIAYAPINEMIEGQLYDQRKYEPVSVLEDESFFDDNFLKFLL